MCLMYSAAPVVLLECSQFYFAEFFMLCGKFEWMSQMGHLPIQLAKNLSTVLCASADAMRMGPTHKHLVL